MTVSLFFVLVVLGSLFGFLYDWISSCISSHWHPPQQLLEPLYEVPGWYTGDLPRKGAGKEHTKSLTG